MQKKESDFLFEQIKNIVLNKELADLQESNDGEFAKLHEAIVYLSECLKESNKFIHEIASGNLSATPPTRKNFIAGSIKELHAGLKHLTWQANQVAQGDYSQHVSFLGEFSEAFNKMILQLKEREERLLLQSKALEQNNELMQLIMDGMTDCIAVVSIENQELLYINTAAEKLYYNETTQVCLCDTDCSFIKNCFNQHFDKSSKHNTRIHKCEINDSFFHIDSFSLHWDGKLANAIHIIDVTKEYKEKSQIEDMAYHDELTGLYNRRYCISQLEQLLKQNTGFVFCLIDADKLKFANDNFGHLAGDEYLKTVAKEISSSFRSSDIICRLGGDEFALIFRGENVEFVSHKMNAINEKLALLQKDYPMAISYGTINVLPNSKLSPKNILNEADSIMYEQKRMKVK